LGASSYTYARLFWSEDSEAWCTGHALAFAFFHGCPEIIVPDNPKPVTTKACPYEPDINPSFNQMANHFGIAVIPARVRTDLPPLTRRAKSANSQQIGH
jgi:transposase